MGLDRDDSREAPVVRSRETADPALPSLVTKSAPAARPGILRRVLESLRAGPGKPTEGGVRLGRYRMLHRLGEGGMGVVFAAEDETLGRQVAVKVISQSDASARRRFEREARAAAGVNHPNVCHVYEIGEEEGRLYIAMELLLGESLSQRLRRGALPLPEVLALGRGLLAALQALHASGIVHRDLKPSNVFLTAHGVKVLDFGLARPVPTGAEPLAPGAELTREGAMVGTPRYMAPEQVVGGPVDARTDIFATAAILYEAACGRPAFHGASVAEVLSATLREQPPALTGPPAVAALDRLLHRALAKDPAERPASAREMAAELETLHASDAADGPSLVRPLTRLLVLPFRLLRADADVDFLGFALADAVSTSLAGIPALVIRSSAANARFAGESPDLRAIASQAEVDLVLLGTILRVDGQLRVATQLVEAPAGTIVASQTLHAPLGDIFRLQDELASRIVQSLSPSLAGTPARKGRPASARAYEFFLRANEVFRDWSQAAVARDLYRQCVLEDPAFAPAWARLGRAHRLLAKYHLERPEENRTRADEAFRRALELDPELPVAHKLFAHHQAERGQAREALLRLVGLARRAANDPEVWAALVHACRYCGLIDASLAAHREARRLDPHAWTSVVYTWWALGDFEAILRDSADGADSELRALALHALGRGTEARSLLEQLRGRPAPPVVVDMLRDLVPLLENGEGAAAALARVVAAHTDPEALALYGSCQAVIGDVEGALASFERSVAGGFHVPRFLREQPWLASLRGSSRMDVLLRRAEAASDEAAAAFRDAGGAQLLGLATA